MSYSGNLSADGTSAEIVIQHNDGTHFSMAGTWGSGTATLQQNRNGTWGTAYYSGGTAITHSADFNEVLDFRRGDKVRWSLSGSTSPDLNWTIS